MNSTSKPINGWRRYKIGDVFTLTPGFAFKSGDFIESGTPVLKIKNVKAGEVVYDDLSYVDNSFVQSRGNFLVRYGDILITLSGNRFDGSKETWVGKVAQFRREGNYLLNQRLGILRPKDSGAADMRCCAYLMSMDEYQQLFISIATSSGGQANLSSSQVLSAEISLPPLREQQAIACILGALDDKIELNRRRNRTLEAMARAIFQSWFVDFDPVKKKCEVRRVKGEIDDSAFPSHFKLFPSNFEDSPLGPIPAGWRVGTAKDVCEFAYGKALKADQRKPGMVPVMGSNGQVGVHSEPLVKGPGIVVGRKGNPGIITWVNTDFFPIDTTFYVVPTSSEIPLTFLVHALDSLKLASLAADSAVPGLNRNIAYGTQLCIPTQAPLLAFTKHTSAIRDRLQAGENESRALATLRDTLLPKLISGELRVPDAERIVGRAV